MSVGVSAGDFIALGGLAWTVYKSCKDAPGSFQGISHDVLSLHALLKETEETFLAQPLPPTSQARLRTILDGCDATLDELQKLVRKYQSLGTQAKRTWDRMRWSANEAGDLRSRLTSSAVLLTGFIATSQVTVQRRLDEFLQEFREGKREGSVVSTQTVDSISTVDKEAWRTIRKELESIGITIAAFNANKDFIIDWFVNAVATGAFEEQAEDGSSDQDLRLLSIDETSESYKSVPTRNNSLPSTPEVAATIIEESPERGKPSPLGLVSSSFTPSSGVPKAPIEPHDTQPILSDKIRHPLQRPAGIPKTVNLVARFSRPRKALLAAAKEGDLGKARAILEDEAKLAVIGDVSLNEAFELASRNEHKAMMNLILDSSADFPLDAALLSASARGSLKAVEILLDRGAKAMAREKTGNMKTALISAVESRRVLVVSLLIDKGANIEAVDKSGQTPLHYAAKVDDANVALILLERGAFVNALDSRQQTPLLEAVCNGRWMWRSTVEVLLDYGADMGARDQHGRTALNLAVNGRRKHVIRLLLERGADIESKDDQGSTPLLTAVCAGHLDIVQLLLLTGADIEARNHLGRTPLIRATISSDLKIVTELLEHGANVRAIDNDGFTPKQIAEKIAEENPKPSEFPYENRVMIDMLRAYEMNATDV